MTATWSVPGMSDILKEVESRGKEVFRESEPFSVPTCTEPPAGWSLQDLKASFRLAFTGVTVRVNIGHIGSSGGKKVAPLQVEGLVSTLSAPSSSSSARATSESGSCIFTGTPVARGFETEWFSLATDVRQFVENDSITITFKVPIRLYLASVVLKDKSTA